MTIAEYNLSVELYADGVYRFILKNLGDSNLSKDIVQDCFEKLWKRYTEVNYSKSKSYLFTSAYHTMIDSIRRQKNNESIDKIPEIVDIGENSYSDLKEILNKAMELLPKVQRSVLILRDYEGYNYKEIETITGLNESQVKVYIYRARKFLKSYLGSAERVI